VPGLLKLHAARNALDCALWDLEAKRSGTPVWQLAGLAKEPEPIVTAYTLSLDTPEKMAEAAAKSAARPLLKIKLGGDGDDERLRAIRSAAPEARLIIDANEGWKPAELDNRLAVCAETGVELVEQPLPAGDDEALRGLGKTDVLICADESAHGKEDLHKLAGKYTAINIKLDKTGGLTEALALAHAARDQGFEIMIGCMLATSLAMAPGHIIAQMAKVVDLDGPLLLAKDRNPGIRFDGSLMFPPPPSYGVERLRPAASTSASTHMPAIHA
jgi:L-alanine-DL-glutamate epimerase-like enolase superfamily enzyme